VVLPVPRGLADDRTGKVLEALIDAGKDVAKAYSELEAAKEEQAPGSPKSKKRLEMERAMASAEARYSATGMQIEAELARVMKSGGSNRATVLMAVIAHNAGRIQDSQALLGRIKPDQLTLRSYLDYLRAITALTKGRQADAEQLLRASWKAAPFAIEPPVLLAGILGSRGFASQETKIDGIAKFADENFDADAYMPVASLVSLHYRIGTTALGARRCDRALTAFKRAEDELSTIEKYWAGKDIRNLLEIGEANALHCQGNKAAAQEAFERVWKRISGKDARALLCQQFSGCSGS
jgi:hypothetical protein